MNENNELLEYIYQTAEMGVFSTTKLIEDINGKENKIKKVISTKLGIEINTITNVDITLSVVLFFFKAATIPSKIPSGTEIKTEIIFNDIEVGSLLIIIDIASTFGM